VYYIICPKIHYFFIQCCFRVNEAANITQTGRHTTAVTYANINKFLEKLIVAHLVRNFLSFMVSNVHYHVNKSLQ